MIDNIVLEDVAELELIVGRSDDVDEYKLDELLEADEVDLTELLEVDKDEVMLDD